MVQPDFTKAVETSSQTMQDSNSAIRNPLLAAAITANLLGSTIMMRNQRLKEIQEAKQAQIPKTASVSDLVNKVKTLFLQRNPEFNQGTIQYTVDGDKTTIELPGEHNVVRELYDSIRTIKDDPGDHKKKALVGAAGTLLGAALATKSYSGPLSDEVNRQLGSPETASTQSKLIALSLPASAYYIANNADRPERQLLGSAAAGLGLAGHDYERQNSNFRGVPKELVPAMLKADAGAGLALGSFIYMNHQLQKASDLKRLQALATMDNVSDSDKAREINRIRTQKDFLTRYPVFRSAPFSEKLRSLYNRFHKPEAVVSKSDYDTYIRTHI